MRNSGIDSFSHFIIPCSFALFGICPLPGKYELPRALARGHAESGEGFSQIINSIPFLLCFLVLDLLALTLFFPSPQSQMAVMSNRFPTDHLLKADRKR
jgi:hypothetical protein